MTDRKGVGGCHQSCSGVAFGLSTIEFSGKMEGYLNLFEKGGESSIVVFECR